MLVVAAIVSGLVQMLAGAYIMRRLRVGALDAVELASKTAVPHPRSARDWPEARLCSVVAAPGPDDDVLVVARWPGRPGTFSSLVLRPDGPGDRAMRLLAHWCDEDTSLSPMPWDDVRAAVTYCNGDD